MKTRQRCPECKQLLEKNSDECYCGWMSAFSGNDYAPDHRCLFANSGRRCPLDGANNHSTHGSSSPWYCLGHLRNLNNLQRCIEILNEAEENFEAMMEDRIDWRVKLIPEEYMAKKANISEIIRTLNVKRRLDNENK